jgi:hypothetical protein
MGARGASNARAPFHRGVKARAEAAEDMGEGRRPIRSRTTSGRGAVMNDFIQKREFTRVPVHIWGTFREGERELVTAEITSLSLRGCYASTFEVLPEGQVHTLKLFTDDGPHTLHITVQARIVRATEDGMGVEFTEMPLESYDHLRKMVLLNSADPDQVEREFRNHIGLRRAG